jgi:hypothetical protein
MILKPKAKPIFEAEIWEYKDRIVAHVTCNRCGEKFSLTLRANPIAILHLGPEQKKALIFSAANRKHDCDTDALPTDKAETNRIINKWHEYKLKTKKLLGDKNEKPA